MLLLHCFSGASWSYIMNVKSLTTYMYVNSGFEWRPSFVSLLLVLGRCKVADEYHVKHSSSLYV